MSNGPLSHKTVGRNHEVSFKDYRVLLIQDGASWFARGIDVDYFAMGKTLASAKRNFVDGLVATVTNHIEKFGNLKKFDVPASGDAVTQYLESPITAQQLLDLQFDLVPIDQLLPAESQFPWDRILFMARPENETAGMTPHYAR